MPEAITCAWCGNSEWVTVKRWYMGMTWALWCNYCCELTVAAPDADAPSGEVR